MQRREIATARQRTDLLVTPTTTKASIIRRAALIALGGNLVLAVLKLIGGVVWGSAALVGDGIDSAGDVAIALVTLFVANQMQHPADKEHPWGHGRAETIASALAAAAVSIVGKLLLAYSQFALGRRSGSAILKANAKNMTGDVLLSVGVVAGLILSLVFNSSIPDTILAALVGVWIIVAAVGIFREANLELMDGGASAEHYRALFDAVRSVEGVHNPHRARMRRIAGFWDIDIDLEVDPALTVEQAHEIATRAEEEIKKNMENVFDIVVHIEPMGDAGETEGYGLYVGAHDQDE